jgi:flagellar biosynthetic protein FliR
MDQVIIPLRPVLIFLVVLARVGGMVTFAPFWSHRAAPAKVRVVLALMLALVVTPVVAPRLATPPANYLGLALVLGGELLIGCALGFIGRLVFSAIEMAAQIISFQMGFSLASTIDPGTQARTAALGTVAQMLGLLVLLAGNGHHWLLAATIRSFQTVAPGGFTVSPTLAELFVRLSADALAVGVALAAPAIVTLLVVEFALAIAGRAAPQLQVMILGFPIKIMVGLWLIGASLYFMPGAMRTTFSGIRQGLQQALAAM